MSSTNEAERFAQTNRLLNCDTAVLCLTLRFMSVFVRLIFEAAILAMNP